MAVADTPLTRQLHGEVDDGDPRALEAFRVARRHLWAGERIDMDDLASKLNVSRATLFRWVGNRELLISEILWQALEPILDRAVDQTSGAGPARVGNIVRRIGDASLREMRGHRTRRPEIAKRLLSPASPTLQARYTAWARGLLEPEVEAGRLQPPTGLDEAAAIIYRMIETFVRAAMANDDPREHERGAVAVEAVLRAWAPRRR